MYLTCTSAAYLETGKHELSIIYTESGRISQLQTGRLAAKQIRTRNHTLQFIGAQEPWFYLLSQRGKETQIARKSPRTKTERLMLYPGA